MGMVLEVVIWYLFFADAIFANMGAWFFPGWYKKKFKGLSRYVPLTKGWGAMYLFLVLWLGYSLYRLGVLTY